MWELKVSEESNIISMVMSTICFETETAGFAQWWPEFQVYLCENKSVESLRARLHKSDVHTQLITFMWTSPSLLLIWKVAVKSFMGNAQPAFRQNLLSQNHQANVICYLQCFNLYPLFKTAQSHLKPQITVDTWGVSGSLWFLICGCNEFGLCKSYGELKRP